MKKTFTLLELIFVISLSSFFIISYSSFVKTIQHKNTNTYDSLFIDLDLNASFEFIQKNILSKNKINLINTQLFYKNKLLLNDVNKFELKKTNNKYFFELCVKKICITRSFDE